MPLENRLSNNYDPSSGIANGIGSLAQAIRMGPMIQAQARMRGAQTGRYNAMAQEALARAGLLNTQSDKAASQVEGAKNIASALQAPGAISKDSMGNIIISAPAFQTVMGEIARTGTGANDIGGGLSKLLTAQNAPNEAGLNRTSRENIAAGQNASREAIAAGKPIILNPGQSAYQRPTDNNPSAADVDNPNNSLASQLIASAPQKTAPEMAPYTITTIRDERNPAYSISDGATNAPPVIKMTNTVTRVPGSRQPVTQAPQKPTRAQAADLVQKLGRDGAIKQLQAQGFDTSGYSD